MLIAAALLIVVAMCALAGVVGGALFLVGYGAGWAHNALRSP